MNYKSISLQILSTITLSLSPLQADWSLYGMDWSFNQSLHVNSSTNTYVNQLNLLNPVEIAIAPAATTAYVINQDNLGGTLDIVDLTTNSVTTTLNVQIPFDVVPFSIAIAPNGNFVYISARDTVADMSYLIEFNVAANTFTGYALGSGQNVYAVGLNPNGNTVYVTLSNGLAVFDLATHTVTNTVTNIFGASRMGITPNGNFAYITSSQSRLFKVDLNTLTLSEIIVPPTSFPENIAITSDGTKAYIANGDLSATVVDLATDTVSFLLIGLSQQGVAINPDNKTVFFSHIYNNPPGFSSVDVATSTITYITTPGFPGYSAITPDQAPVAAFGATIAPQGSPTNFLANATTETGTIESYSWDFGDGVTETTLVPSTSHVYANSGVFQATLTVTNSAGTSTTPIFTGHGLTNNGGPSAMTGSQLAIPAAVATINPPVFQLGKRVINKFLLQKNYADKLEWSAPTSGTVPVLYRIYSDPALTNLLGSVKASSNSSNSNSDSVKFYKFFGKDVGKFSTNTYYIVSVSSNNVSSAPLIITVTPM